MGLFAAAPPRGRGASSSSAPPSTTHRRAAPDDDDDDDEEKDGLLLFLSRDKGKAKSSQPRWDRSIPRPRQRGERRAAKSSAGLGGYLAGPHASLTQCSGVIHHLVPVHATPHSPHWWAPGPTTGSGQGVLTTTTQAQNGDDLPSGWILIQARGLAS
jgi:hypothetical protein